MSGTISTTNRPKRVPYFQRSLKGRSSSLLSGSSTRAEVAHRVIEAHLLDHRNLALVFGKPRCAAPPIPDVGMRKCEEVSPAGPYRRSVPGKKRRTCAERPAKLVNPTNRGSTEQRITRRTWPLHFLFCRLSSRYLQCNRWFNTAEKVEIRQGGTATLPSVVLNGG